MNEPVRWKDQLLTTKFFVPAPHRAPILRPRLTKLLEEGLQRKLTLLSAPAGFGKTTLVSGWIKSRQEEGFSVAWVSLEESDNDPPLRFWMCLLTALNSSYPDIGRQALALLYHALFAEALRYRLQQMDGVDISLLHSRASHWYAGQGYLNEAIQHALQAHAWPWAADLIESKAGPGKSLFSRGESRMIRRWLQRLPEANIRTRPRLCLAYARSMRLASQPGVAEAWLQAAEAALLASTSAPSSLSAHPTHDSEGSENDTSFFPKGHEQDRMLGEILALRARLAGDQGDSRAAMDLCQLAETHLSADDY